MTLPFWSARAVLFLLLASTFSLLLLRRGGSGGATLVPVLALVLLVALLVPIAVDWFLFLDPDAHFSGFALPVLANFFLGALCVSILLAYPRRAAIERPGILGSLLLAALLAWAYLSFTQYFITWSDNLPFGVRWYADRGTGAWAAVEFALVALRLLPLLLLLFAPVRRRMSRLAALCALALAGNALEALWLIVPARGGLPGYGTPVAALLGLVVAAGLGLIGRALLPSPRFGKPA